MNTLKNDTPTATVLLAKNFLSLSEIRGVLDFARTHRWLLRIPRMLNLGREIRDWHGDGIITDNGSALAQLRRRKVAIVATTDLVLSLNQVADVVVSSDDRKIGGMAAEFFCRKGYRNFACCAVNRRRDAFVETLRQRGLETVIIPPLDLGSGLKGGTYLAQKLRELPKPCALFCDNDFDAAVVADTAQSLGLDIPHDIAILGVGNEVAFQNPNVLELSSVDSRLYDRAFFAAQQMAKLLSGELPRRKEEETPRFFVLPPAGIVERRSTDHWAVTGDRLGKMVRFLRANAENPDFKVSEIGKKFLLTPSTVYRNFMEHFGLSPKAFLLEERLRLAQRRLLESNDTLAAVAEECGFPDVTAFYAAFRHQYGLPPGAWRRASCLCGGEKPFP